VGTETFYPRLLRSLAKKKRTGVGGKERGAYTEEKYNAGAPESKKFS